MNTSETPGIILGVGEWASGYTSVDMGEDGIVGMVTFHAVTPGEYEVGEDVEMDSLIDKSRPDFIRSSSGGLWGSLPPPPPPPPKEPEKIKKIISVEKEFEIYRDREMKQLESDFDKMVKMLKENNKDN